MLTDSVGINFGIEGFTSVNRRDSSATDLVFVTHVGETMSFMFLVICLIGLLIRSINGDFLPDKPTFSVEIFGNLGTWSTYICSVCALSFFSSSFPRII